ncbi:uncharacterized protein LOC110990561 isoform X1 [Acanthaster planci]|uniref:Uncharacterized protein LOC110990561 isoform X1 n=1 Tax=Acanthaster planci TaxID=133434 RepID=A0A8B8A0M0_ACAPL|nr:uncharacterized protein LOC110990561 isoform X1 [Acanthaster planci]
MSQRSNISPKNKNETERAKYSEEWHGFNLRTQRFGESRTTNFTALPQLKRQRKQRSDVTHPHCHMPDVRPTTSSTGVTRAAEDFGGHPAAAGTDHSYTAASAEDMCPLLADFYKVQDDLPDVLIPVLEELGCLSKAPLFQHQQPYQRVSKQIVSPLMKLAMNFVALLFGLTCHRRNTEESTQWT